MVKTILSQFWQKEGDVIIANTIAFHKGLKPLKKKIEIF